MKMTQKMSLFKFACVCCSL